jgi:filamentous hemagglutinin family protein
MGGTRVIPRFSLCAAAFAFALGPTKESAAQIATDGSLGPPAQALIGPNYTIDSTLGTTRGSNLFHSFGAFNVHTGESATFTSSQPAPVTNVLARVTGGQSSSVDGLLRSTIPGANLYLFNPSGVAFGPNAVLDVPGAFHVSTADSLRLVDGGIFHANLQQVSVLSAAPPVAFGFLNPAPAAVSFDRSTMQVPEGSAFSVIAGDVSLSGATLRAPGGRLQIASVASAGEVIPALAGETPNLQMDSFSGLGQIHLLQGANATVSSAAGAGTVLIRGGRLVVDSFASINANTTGSGNGAELGIDVRVADEAVFTGGAQILAFSTAAGRAGDIQMSADKLQVVNGAFVSSGTFSTAFARNLNLNVGTLEILDGGQIVVQTRGPADAGNLNVAAGSIVMSGINGSFNTGLFAGQFGSFGTGRSGNVRVDAERISMVGSGNPNLVTGVFGSTFGPGPGGTVEVNAQTLDMHSNTGVQNTTFGAGAGGVLSVHVKNISLVGSTDPNVFTGIFANTFGSGPGGSIQVVADRMQLANHAGVSAAGFSTGDAGSVTVQAGSLEISSGSSIYTNVLFGSGNAGNLSVTADNLLIAGFQHSADPFGSTFDFTGLSTSTGPFGQRGGDMSVHANSIVLENKAGIFSSSSGAGVAGNIHIVADDLRVSNRSAISTNAFGSGPGGKIDIVAGKVTVDGAGPPLGPSDSVVSAIASQAGTSGGAAGHITIKAGRLEVLDGAKISTQTYGAGDGGNLSITADSVLVSGVNVELQDHLRALPGGTVDSARSAILASSERALIGDQATGNAGTIRVAARDIHMGAGGSISSTTNTAGVGGKIELIGGTVSLASGALISAESSTSGNAGKAGDILITARGAVDIAASSITTAADHAAGGSIAIQGNEVSLVDGALVSAKSSGLGDAGNISIVATHALTFANSIISTEALGADGGNIKLTAQHMVWVADSQITTSVESGTGMGGNISIDPQFVILKDSSITANAFGGPGGNITIVADNYLTDALSVVQASSILSAPGTVQIQSPENNLAGNIAQLPRELTDASTLLAGSCAARRTGAPSSFTVAGRGGVPVDPDGYLPSFLATGVPFAGAPSISGSGAPAAALALSMSIPDCGR